MKSVNRKRIENKNPETVIQNAIKNWVNEGLNVGDKLTHKHNPKIEIELIEPTNKGWKVYQIEKGKKKIAYFNKQDISGDKSLFELVTPLKTDNKIKITELKRIIREEIQKLKESVINENFIPKVGTIDDFMLKKLLLKNPKVKSLLSTKEMNFLKKPDTDVIQHESKPFNTIVTNGKLEFEIDGKKYVLVTPLKKARPEIISYYSKNESLKKDNKMKITELKRMIREIIKEETEYQQFFRKALEKTGKSIPQMSDDEKKDFFNKIDAAWKGKGEKKESVDEALSVDPRKVYGGTGAKEGMVLTSQKGLMKILDLSKKNPSNVFLVSDDNYTNFGPFYVKNGKVAKYTVANPNYDLEKNKVRTVKVPSDVILKFKVVESVNEVASRTAMEIGGLTGMNKDAIQKFVDEHNLDIEKVFQFVKKGKLSDRMDFMTAVVGNPGNPIQKKMIKMFSESVNEAKYDVSGFKKDSSWKKKMQQRSEFGNLLSPNDVKFLINPKADTFIKGNTLIITDGNRWMVFNISSPVTKVKRLGNAPDTVKGLVGK